MFHARYSFHQRLQSIFFKLSIFYCRFAIFHCLNAEMKDSMRQGVMIN